MYLVGASPRVAREIPGTTDASKHGVDTYQMTFALAGESGIWSDPAFRDRFRPMFFNNIEEIRSFYAKLVKANPAKFPT